MTDRPAARPFLLATLACLLVACIAFDFGTEDEEEAATPDTTTALACASRKVHCVDVKPGPTQEFRTIQAAVNAARPGHTVLVFDGSYAGFIVSRSGTAARRITVKAQGGAAVINRPDRAGEGIRVSDASFVTIEGFTIIGMPEYGLAARDTDPAHPMHGLVIRGNTVRNSRSANIYLSEVSDSLVEGNSASGSVRSHGIYLANGGSDNTILRGNHCFDNHVNGIHLNGDEDVGPGGDGLHKGIVIESNVIHGNVANGLDLDGIQDSLIRNNLIYNNGRNAVRAFQIDAAAGPKNLAIVNNTLVVPSGGGWPIKLTADLGGHTIFNNVLLNAAASGSIAVDNRNFHSDNNIVKSGFSLDGDETIISLAAWQAAGHDLASAPATPAALFANPAADAYALKAGAPAANAGLASFNGVSAPQADIAGVARPQGSGYDIGAYESF